jgi:YidC/Oxa1 family membrane protein insertase
MDNQRLILFIALAMTVLLLWQAWEQEHRPPLPTTPTATSAPASTVPPPPTGTVPAASTAPGAVPPPGQRITITTDVYTAEIDTRGGDLRHLGLRRHPVQIDQPNNPFPLFTDTGDEYYIAQSGLIGREVDWPNHNSLYTAAQTTYSLPAGQDSLSVPLTWTGPDGLRVTKTYTFRRDAYAVTVDYTIQNAGKATVDAYLYAQLVRSHKEQKSMLSAAPSYVGGAMYSSEKKYEKITFDDMLKKPLERRVTGGWVAFLQHYFVAAWMPPATSADDFYTKNDAEGRHILGYKSVAPATIAAGQTATLTTTLYAGPKEQKRLRAQAEGMILTVDYGLLTIIAAPLFQLLQYIHGVLGNWGWAIIVLTILIKLVFYPLSAASYKSMAHMRRVQPKMQAIKERFGDDRQKLNQAMMELYKKEKINPLGGCLPIVVQIPVFISLYWVLLESVEMRQAPFALWIHDLSSADPYFVLPVLMGASMLVTQWLSPQMGDPLQRKVMMAMPVVFTVFFAFFPAGLVLYWTAQNILSILQQWSITRRVEAGTVK